MTDNRKHCEFEVNGIRHTALLDEDDQERFKARAVQNKARTPANKARGGASND